MDGGEHHYFWNSMDLRPDRWWNWFEPVSLFAVFTSAALALHEHLGRLHATRCFISFLAWDLAAFTGRLHLAAEDDDTSRLEGIHLRRMTVLMLASGGLGVLALRIQINFLLNGCFDDVPYGVGNRADRKLAAEKR